MVARGLATSRHMHQPSYASHHLLRTVPANATTVKAKMLEPTQRSLNIAIAGNTGAGKSTLVNVLMGKKSAPVSNDVKPCTMKRKEYMVVEGGTSYHLWDTRGLNEGSEALVARFLKRARILPDADRELKKFVRGKNPSVDLVILCIDAKKIQVDVHWKILDKIYGNLCRNQLPVVVVVMGLEEMEFRSSRWKSTCSDAAKKVVKEFPAVNRMEGVPEFEDLGDERLHGCRNRILTLISRACSTLPIDRRVRHR